MQRDDLRQCIGSGLEYILARQTQAGCWVDWDLPPGPSDMWTTAAVGWKLLSARIEFGPLLEASVWNASRWLSAAMTEDGGWGYNSTVESDADSTAQSILFLSHQPGGVSGHSYDRLRQFQRPDGGFATFEPFPGGKSWCVSHPDVTPIALLALLTKFPADDPAIRIGIAHVVGQDRSTKGVWNSFWWESFLYATQANLRLLNSLSMHTEMQRTTAATVLGSRAETPLLMAQKLGCLSMIGSAEIRPRVAEIASQLRREQQQDGSWSSTPSLRLTRRDCSEPWNERDSGVLFNDSQRLFTTATVIEALCGVSTRCR